MKTIHASKEYIDKLKSLPATKPERITSINFCGYNFPLIENPLFPFEIMYDACSIETRDEIKIASGEWIHGAIIPNIEVEMPKPSWDFSFDILQKQIDNPFRNYFERNWGMEIFKF